MNSEINVDEVIRTIQFSEIVQKGYKVMSNDEFDRIVNGVLNLQQQNKELHNKIDKLEEHSRGNIEACENRLNSPFCNFERVTKELMIHKNYLEILKDSDVK